MNVPGANGVGLVVMDWTLAVGALLACVFQLAALRSKEVSDSPMVDGARRIKVAGWALVTGWVVIVMVVDGDLLVPIYGAIPLVLLAWGDAFGAVARLWAADPPPRFRHMLSDPMPLWTDSSQQRHR